MKITIIRHAKVDFHFPYGFKPEGQIAAADQYDSAPIIKAGAYSIRTVAPVFVSKLRRSRDSALLIFGDREFIESDLFNEVPLLPFTNKNIWFPDFVWDIGGRLSWFFYGENQPELKPETRKRADKAIDLLEKAELTGVKECYLVSHAFFMHTLFRQLRKRGYSSNSSRLRIDNLQQFVFTK